MEVDRNAYVFCLNSLTGLDPANPPFFPAILLDHLSHSDAEFVDIIHTDAGLYGQPYSTATADFWPNDGLTLQPGCPLRSIPLSENGDFHLQIAQFSNHVASLRCKFILYLDLCSHRRSFSYYSESVAAPKGTTFQAVSARNWSRFKDGDKNSSNIVNMGIDCSTK